MSVHVWTLLVDLRDDVLCLLHYSVFQTAAHCPVGDELVTSQVVRLRPVSPRADRDRRYRAKPHPGAGHTVIGSLS